MGGIEMVFNLTFENGNHNPNRKSLTAINLPIAFLDVDKKDVMF
jgi:hypothetical protein